MTIVNTSKRQRLGNAIVKFSAPIMTPTHSMRPFARRLSLPARRLSESFVTAVATPFRTAHVGDVELLSDSYFPPRELTAEPSSFCPEDPVAQEVQTIEPEISIEAIDCTAIRAVKVEELPYHQAKKLNKIRRVSRKMKSLLYFRQLSSSLPVLRL